MRVGRLSAWLLAVAFWVGFALLIEQGPEVDMRVRALEWTALALLSVAALWSWRPGRFANIPPCLARWLADEESPRTSGR